MVCFSLFSAWRISHSCDIIKALHCVSPTKRYSFMWTCPYANTLSVIHTIWNRKALCPRPILLHHISSGRSELDDRDKRFFALCHRSTFPCQQHIYIVSVRFHHYHSTVVNTWFIVHGMSDKRTTHYKTVSKKINLCFDESVFIICFFVPVKSNFRIDRTSGNILTRDFFVCWFTFHSFIE